MDKQEESVPRAGSSGRRQPAENKSDQCPARGDVARSDSNKISEEGQRLKKEMRIFLILYIKIGVHLRVEGQAVALGQARAHVRAHMEMIIFIGLGLALALVQEI